MAEQNPEANLANDDQPERPAQKSRRRFVIIGVVAVLVVGAVLFWWHSTYYEDTDDAQVSGHLAQISTRVSGQVLKVYVEENSEVKAGDVLVELDPKDLEVAVKQDEASLESAEANYESAKVNVPITDINTTNQIRSTGSDVEGAQATVQSSQLQLQAAQAKVAQAQADYVKAQQDVDRYTPLVQKDVISKQQFDQAVATANADKAAVDSARANELSAKAQVIFAQQKVKQA